jgi:hypothetical protein
MDPIFDLTDGSIGMDLGGGMIMDSDGDLMLNMGGGMAVDSDGDVHIISHTGNDNDDMF